MSESAATSVKQLLQTQHSALQRIFAKVRQLNELNELLKKELEPELVKHCMVANVYTDRLIVLVENGSIATRLRFSVPDLLPRLKAHNLLKDIKTVECRIGQLK